MRAQPRRPTRAPARRQRSDKRRLERSDDVLWTIAPPGILLHHVGRRRYLELDEVGYLLWGLLDGARNVDAVVELCALAFEGRDNASVARIRALVTMLVDQGFVEVRRP